MPSITRLTAAILVIGVAACANDTPTSVDLGTPSKASDDRTTGELASDQGRLIVLFEAEAGINPRVPVELSFDGRTSEMIALPRGPKNYALGPGEHSVKVALAQPDCTVIGVPADIGSSYFGRFTMLENSTHYFRITVDCASKGYLVAKVKTTGENLAQGYTFRIWSEVHGAREMRAVADGNSVFWDLPVGTWHVEMTDIPSNCRLQGIGVPLPPGVIGDNRIAVHSPGTAIFYTGTCT